MTEIRCCCVADNLIGHIDHEAGLLAGLELRELDDDTEAFAAEGRDVGALPTFVTSIHKGKGGKTWRKK